jgi:hypothetical protein
MSRANKSHLQICLAVHSFKFDLVAFSALEASEAISRAHGHTYASPASISFLQGQNVGYRNGCVVDLAPGCGCGRGHPSPWHALI